jgi:hypothetical protein
VREVFMKHHADLLDAAFWQAHKERILAGHVHDVFPYEPPSASPPGARPAARRGEAADTGAKLAASASSRTPVKEPAMTDPIVIVSAARTPIGGLLGDFSRPRRLGTGRGGHQGRRRARRRARRRRRRGAVGQLPDGRPGPGARRARRC